MDLLTGEKQIKQQVLRLICRKLDVVSFANCDGVYRASPRLHDHQPQFKFGQHNGDYTLYRKLRMRCRVSDACETR
jgi:hypothetical protein